MESVKSPGQYLHASAPYKVDYWTTASEINLGIQPAGLTVVKSWRPTVSEENIVRGGSMVRLFHKELEAYVVAEGLFNDVITEDVHLRIREVDQLIPKTLYPSTSANCFWQVGSIPEILTIKDLQHLGL